MDEQTSAWDGVDIAGLLDLSSPEPGRFRSRLAEVNEHGRVYGGQLLGQALAAAARTVPADRPATAMQFMFLAGALPEIPINYEVDHTPGRQTLFVAPRKRFAERRTNRLRRERIVRHRDRFARAYGAGRRLIVASTRTPRAYPNCRISPAPRQRRSSAHSPTGFSRTSPSTSARPSSTTCCVPIRTNRACGSGSGCVDRCRTIRRCTRRPSPISRIIGSTSLPAS